MQAEFDAELDIYDKEPNGDAKLREMEKCHGVNVENGLEAKVKRLKKQIDAIERKAQNASEASLKQDLVSAKREELMLLQEF
ncbi:hypothetical protein L596_021867 [Steinernema carpocapsae]|uniref:Uncharacterized protein n=1 Tax=Steinernema carpocapsae TaxID=34508 RepID=A0A4U5MK38_STECR|nr:hypothetical protein L596_021867 [Steinernema carpocapsae]